MKLKVLLLMILVLNIGSGCAPYNIKDDKEKVNHHSYKINLPEPLFIINL